MTSSTVEILKAARKKIEKPENWTRGAFARDDRDEPVPSRAAKAVCWCAAGAVCFTSRAVNGLMTAWEELDKSAPHGNAALFNDDPNTEHADVLKLFDDTIERLEGTTQ